MDVRYIAVPQHFRHQQGIALWGRGSAKPANHHLALPLQAPSPSPVEPLPSPSPLPSPAPVVVEQNRFTQGDFTLEWHVVQDSIVLTMAMRAQGVCDGNGWVIQRGELRIHSQCQHGADGLALDCQG